MKIKNIENVNTFLSVVDSCNGNVYLTSNEGDRINLKSKISQYVAIAALVGTHGDELELWCDSRDDEVKFLKMFNSNPEML